MNKDQFFTYLDNPNLIQGASLNDLKDIIDTFPFFHTAHVLYLKGLHNNKSLKFNIQLPRSATHIPDRKKLFRLLFYDEILTDQSLTAPTESLLDHNLMDVTIEESEVKDDETPVELLDFSFTENDVSPKQPFESSYYSDDKNKESDISLELEYGSGYRIEDLEPSDDVYLSSYFTFEEWINLVKDENQEHRDESYAPARSKAKDEKDNLIDNFIKGKPKILVGVKSETSSNDFSKNGLDESPEFITETLAKIYIQQAYYEKAIFAYQKLSLKNPEKNSYFANQIEKLKKLIKEQ